MINSLKPQNVFKIFKEISDIPHGSFHTEEIAQYCLNFAKNHGLDARSDDAGNVVIYVPGTPGYENSEPVIIQGHIDMVCDKELGAEIDMDKEGLKLCTDGVNLWADQTTLGGDDGISVAMMFALVDEESCEHPPLEFLLTNDEEVGMLGARDFDPSYVKGKRLINIDSEEEGILYVSCAGGVRGDASVPVSYREVEAGQKAFEINIQGLLGGHSGCEIHTQRANANRVLADCLQAMNAAAPIRLAALEGGVKDNAIPKVCTATVLCAESDYPAVAACFEKKLALYKEDFALIDPDLTGSLREADPVPKALDRESTGRIIFALNYAPDGMIRKSPAMDNLVETSLNMGIVSLEEDRLSLAFLLRSNTSCGKDILADRVTGFIRFLGGDVEYSSDYPAWEYRQDSPLRDTMVDCFKEVYGTEPEVAAIHAGLECGILSGKMPDVDFISFGPNVKDVHTPKETIEIASVERSYNYLKTVLAKLK